MELIIITGMSGAGKSQVVNALEDIGYFCVDNIPPELIVTFSRLVSDSGEHQKTALVTDSRAGKSFDKLFCALDELSELDIPHKLMFIDADDEYGWEVITGDELPSAQWEHTFLMTEHGLEILTY